MRLLKQLARTLWHGALRRRRLLARRLTSEVGRSGAPAARSGRPSRPFRLARGIYRAKRFIQDVLTGAAPLRPAPFAFWKRKIDTAFHLKLHSWATRPIAKPFDPYLAHARNNRPTKDDLERMRHLAESFEHRPLISIIVPVYDAQPHWVERLIRSVLAQTYDRWELLLIDDGSPSRETETALRHWLDTDERISIERLPANGGVSVATNRGANLAHGEFLAFVDHDDELTSDALWQVVEHLQREPDCDLIYSDEELVPEGSTAAYPYFKPDFSPELLTAYNYMCHLLVVRKRLFDEVGQLRPETDGAQDYDLILRMIDRTARIAHIPRVLYRWHVAPRSYSREIDADTGRLKQRESLEPVTRRVVQDYLDRHGIPADCVIDESWSMPRFRPEDRGKVSIVICTRDHPWLLARAVRSIERHTEYPNYEIVVIDNGSRTLLGRVCLRWLGRRHRVERMPSGSDGFNFSRLNNRAARMVDGKYLLFLNDDTRVLAKGWLSALVGYQQFEGVGATGARLLFPDGSVQHAGLVLGAMGWGPWHALIGVKPPTKKHHQGYASYPHNCIAVTGACLLTPRELFLETGGFDEDRFAVAFNDVDYCLRLHQAGYRMAFAPQAELIHHEGKSRGRLVNALEIADLRAKYVGWTDPYWNRSFSRESPHFAIGSRRHARRLRPGRVPRVLIAARPSRPGEPWPRWEELFDQLVERGRCAYAMLADAPSSVNPFDAAAFDLVYAHEREMCPAIEQAHRARLPSIWHLPDQVLLPSGRSRRDGADLLRSCGALRLPYQVVFNNSHTLAWAACGVPRDNFVALDGVPFDDSARGFDRCSARERMRRHWGIDGRSTVFLAVLPLGPDSGWEVLIDAFARLDRRRSEKAFLFLVGQGAHDYRYVRRLHGRLAKRGRRQAIVINPNDLRDFHATADVVLAHPTSDLRPLWLMQAMQFGLPAIGTGALRESDLLYPEGTGVLARAFDAGSIARGMRAMIDDPGRRAWMGRQARAWIDSRAHPAMVLDWWGDLLLEASELGVPIPAGRATLAPSASWPASALFASAPGNDGADARNDERAHEADLASTSDRSPITIRSSISFDEDARIG